MSEVYLHALEFLSPLVEYADQLIAHITPGRRKRVICGDVNNHRFYSHDRDDVGICRNTKTLVEVLRTSYMYEEVNEDNVFSFEMRQKYGYRIYEHRFLDW